MFDPVEERIARLRETLSKLNDHALKTRLTGLRKQAMEERTRIDFSASPEADKVPLLAVIVGNGGGLTEDNDVEWVVRTARKIARKAFDARWEDRECGIRDEALLRAEMGVIHSIVEDREARRRREIMAAGTTQTILKGDDS